MSFLIAPPHLLEDKPSFEKIPSSILQEIENLLKSPVTGGFPAYGGFSASASFILELRNGRKIFAKGNHPDEMAHGAENIRQEVFAYQNIPILRDISPAYLGMISEDDEDGWMLGLWGYVPDVKEKPGAEDIEKIIDVMSAWHSVPAEKLGLKPAREKSYISFFFNNEKKWQRFLSEEKIRDKFSGLFVSPIDAQAWLKKNLPVLCDLQAQATAMTGPSGIIHGDLRLDNFLLSQNKTFVIDWPNACYGPVIFDLIFLFSHMESVGLARVEDLMTLYQSKRAAVFSNKDLAVMLAAVAGYFADQAYREVPTRLPRLRWMQKSMLLAQLRALHRLGYVDSLPIMLGEG